MNKVRVQHLLLLTCILLAGKQLCAMELDKLKNEYLVWGKAVDSSDSTTSQNALDSFKKSSKELSEKLTKQRRICNKTQLRNGFLENQYLDLQNESPSFNPIMKKNYDDEINPGYQQIFIANSSVETVNKEEMLCKQLEHINSRINISIELLPDFSLSHKDAYNILKIDYIATSFYALTTLASIVLAKKTHYWSLIPAGLFLVGTIMKALDTTTLHKKLHDTIETGFNQFNFDKSLKEIQSNVKSLEDQNQKFASYVGEKLSCTSKNWNEGIKPIIGSNWLMRLVLPNFNKETMKKIKNISKQLNDLAESVGSNTL
jgi:hypothetical protein